MESVEDLARDGYYVKVEPEQAVANLIKALGKGVLKVMSKMGVSTVASYTGAQIFEAVGLSQARRRPLLHRHHLQARRHRARHDRRGGRPPARHGVPAGRHRAGAPRSSRSAASTSGAGRASRTCSTPRRSSGCSTPPGPAATTSSSSTPQRVDEQSERLMTLRGLFRFKDGAGAHPVPIDEVEPVSEIVKRFSTGAMSYGSISREAHETLAIAMNRLGAKSNTGEGGEDADRLHDPERRSAIKQVASGRFGVTSEYLTNADDIQIKMAQGAKPGEGGQLPGNKVYPWVAQDPALDAGRRPDQPAAAPRHLLDRGPGAADPRPQERQPVGARPREAGLRGRRRHRRGRRLEGARRRRADLRPRRRHRRLAADVAQARRRPLGARPGRDPADAAAQRAARPDRRPDRRPAEDRSRRRDRRPARRRGVRLRDRAAGRLRLHHDAGLPPRHLPGRRRHPEPGAARALQRQAGVRRRRSSSTSPRRSASCSPSWASAPWPRRSGGSTRSTRARRSTTGRRLGST